MADADAAYIRGRVVEALDLLGSADAQLAYQRDVPIAQVPYEALDGWPEGLVDDADARACFAADEWQAILAFDAAWRRVEAQPALYMRLDAEDVIGTPAWDTLIAAAAAARAAFPA